MNSNDFSVFPESATESLALLWVKSQDISGKTPEQLCELYWNAYFRIRKVQESVRSQALRSTQ